MKSAKRRVVVFVLLFAAGSRAEQPLSFELTFSPKVRKEPFTGRVVIFMSEEEGGQPRLKHSWTSRAPVFGKDVRNWRPGEKLTLTEVDGFPYDLSELPRKKYVVQAVMHTNPDEPHSGRAPGNLYSKPIDVDLAAEDFGGAIKLEIKKRIPAPTADSVIPRSRLVELRSNLLSRFHGRDVTLRAVVILPEEYEDNPDRKFPTLYVIPGFGGDHLQAGMMAAMLGKPRTPMVRVGLDATCALGHHVFADSANNGPWGTALVEELIPHLEKEYRLVPEPGARLLTGHSSGGWSSLWLQISHPDYFGGTWSTSPDPVDFHDFTGLDLYDPKSNFFKTADGGRRPVMRQSGKVKLWLEDFATMEDVIGPGGQIHSFEAVFCPRGADGRPEPIFDRTTGEINTKTVKAWRKYDIVDKLKREWPTLGPKLAGKITVICGDEDNFYLEGAVRRLKKELEELGSDARIVLVPGKDHGTVMFSPPYRKMMTEMSERVARFQPTSGPAASEPDTP